MKEGGYLVIRDTIEAQREHDVSLRFHCAPGVRVEDATQNVVRLRIADAGSGEEMRVQLHFLGDVDRVEWESDWVSSCYGRREQAPVCTASARRVGRQEIVTVVIPFAGESVSVSEQLRSGAHVISIVRGDVQETLLVQEASSEVIAVVPRPAHVPRVSTAIHHAIQR